MHGKGVLKRGGRKQRRRSKKQIVRCFQRHLPLRRSVLSTFPLLLLFIPFFFPSPSIDPLTTNESHSETESIEGDPAFTNKEKDECNGKQGRGGREVTR
mmetsp:Transcript_41244/g.81347  ORF Transcript_41244/g.81347 Transcript_41244/m.81347 type:complete len:99 (+) Transcript_41244:530-826(+)